MKLSLGANVVRYITLALNLLFMLTGILLIALGGYAMNQNVPGLSSHNIATGIIVLGVLVFLVSLIGCWGAARENRILLLVYFVLVLIFVLIEFCLGIAAYVKRDDLESFLDVQWSNLYESDTLIIDDIETLFKCCGYHNVTDRAVPPYYKDDPAVCTEFHGFNIPCKDGVVSTVEESIVAAGGTAIAIAVIQIICLAFSCYLFVKVPRNRDDDMLLDEATR